MHITFTEAAVKHIHTRMQGNGAALKLDYDTEGCGCAVNGVARLLLVRDAKPSGGEALADGPPFPVLYEKEHAVYFEDRMTVDYSQPRKAFVLKSDNQYYNSSMPLVDPTGNRA